MLYFILMLVGIGLSIVIIMDARKGLKDANPPSSVAKRIQDEDARKAKLSSAKRWLAEQKAKEGTSRVTYHNVYNDGIGRAFTTLVSCIESDVHKTSVGRVMITCFLDTNYVKVQHLKI